MLIQKNLILLLSISLLFIGCVNKKQEKQKEQDCTQNWYKKVESRIPTGDEHGHGPDIGSLEWKNVVEKRIGISGNKIVPNISSKQWCTYINKILFENEK